MQPETNLPEDEENTVTQFYTSVAQTWEAMIDDCRTAKKSILYDQFIVCDDEIGNRFLSLLAAKAEKGIQITLNLDKIGSRSVYHSEHIKKIKDHGGKVNFYNNINLINVALPWTWLPRNHAKLLLVDSRIAYIGGVCLQDSMAEWRDLMIRLDGENGATIAHDYDDQKSRPKSTLKSLDDNIEYILSEPSIKPNALYAELLRRLRQAEKTVEIVTPYFMPPSRLKHALLAAVARNVDVKIVVSGQDTLLAHYTGLSYLPRLIKRGITAYYHKHEVCHAKYVIVDGKWAMVGSMNLDYLSLAYNREGNVSVTDQSIIDELRAIFDQTRGASLYLKEDFFRKMSLWQQIIGFAGRPFKKVM